MPEWNLADLYSAPDAPEIARDIEVAAGAARHIKERYQGKLAALGNDGAALATAIEKFEHLVEMLGKLGSYAGLYYAANQADPERAKFYGDISEKLTAAVGPLQAVDRKRT
jgi:oligoendopeptidase F